VIPDSFKQDLLNRVDIVDVVSRYVQLKKGGANYLGLCPFHGEKTPSFTVSPAKQFYHCFGCGAHGNAIGFQMEYGGMGYIDAIKDLASSVGMQVPEAQPRSPEEAIRKERETDLYPVMERAMEFYRAELKKSPKAIEYLKGRGLTGEVAARFRVGYAPDDWNALKQAFSDYADKALVECGLVIENEGKRYDRFRDRVMFPICSARGAVIGFGGRVLGTGEPKYLNSPETPLFEKGREVYGLVQARDAIRAAGRVLVVEGYMDVVALAQFGVGYAVATLGTATTPVHVSKLLRLADELVFCFDGDAAGRKAAWRALEVSLPLAADHKPVRFLFLPDGDDPDTYVRRHGKEAFEQRVRESLTLSGFLLSELRGQSEFATAEGRSRFLAAAKAYVHKIAAPALRLQVVKEVAALAQVSQEEAEGLLDLKVAPSAKAAPSYRRPAPARASAPTRSSTEAQLLMWVLADPGRVCQVDLALLEPTLPETSFLAEIKRCAEDRDAGELTQPILIEMFRGSEHEPVLGSAQKAMLDLDLAQETAESEIAMCLLTLRIQRTNDEVERLKKTVGQDPRDRAKQVLLQAKLQELDQMKRMRREGRFAQ
jgi:DNA primase